MIHEHAASYKRKSSKFPRLQLLCPVDQGREHALIDQLASAYTYFQGSTAMAKFAIIILLPIQTCETILVAPSHLSRSTVDENR